MKECPFSHIIIITHVYLYNLIIYILYMFMNYLTVHDHFCITARDVTQIDGRINKQHAAHISAKKEKRKRKRSTHVSDKIQTSCSTVAVLPRNCH